MIGSYLLGKNESRKKTYKSEKNIVNELLNFHSFSQYQEDIVLFCVFYDIENGFYIDVGANDPVKMSVTKSFYLRGWNGINIEPLPNKYELLLNDRKRDINLNFGVGKEKVLLLYI